MLVIILGGSCLMYAVAWYRAGEDTDCARYHDGALSSHVVKFSWSYITRYVNADCTRNSTDRRSVSGGVILCTGACVLLFLRKQMCGA